MSDKEIQKILLQLKTLKAENEKLKEENAYLKFRIEEFQFKRYKPKRKPPDNTPPAPPAPKKKPGGLFGHIGWFRKKPKTIDRIRESPFSKILFPPEKNRPPIQQNHGGALAYSSA